MGRRRSWSLRTALASVLALSSLGVFAAFGALGAAEPASATAQYEYNTAHLVVVKHVVNDNGRTAVASDFTLTIGGIVAGGGNSFPGSESGTDKLVIVGTLLRERGGAGRIPGDVLFRLQRIDFRRSDDHLHRHEQRHRGAAGPGDALLPRQHDRRAAEVRRASARPGSQTRPLLDSQRPSTETNEIETIRVSESALSAQLRNGDTLGPGP